jgi:energy-coupling factor transporter ATP-binding protein EcfA2
MFRLENVSFAYPKSEALFQNLNVTLKTEKITLISGVNGSGKTTLLRMLSGLEKGYQGNIFVKNSSIRNFSIHDLNEHLFYLKQEPYYNTIGATADEDLLIAQTQFRLQDNSNLAKQRIELLSEQDLADFQEEPLWELSFGQLKRVGFALAALQTTKYLLLDEPLTGLDKAAILRFRKWLMERKQKKLGLLLITHQIVELQELIDVHYQIQDKNLVKV